MPTSEDIVAFVAIFLTLCGVATVHGFRKWREESKRPEGYREPLGWDPFHEMRHEVVLLNDRQVYHYPSCWCRVMLAKIRGQMEPDEAVGGEPAPDLTEELTTPRAEWVAAESIDHAQEFPIVRPDQTQSGSEAADRGPGFAETQFVEAVRPPLHTQEMPIVPPAPKRTRQPIKPLNQPETRPNWTNPMLRSARPKPAQPEQGHTRDLKPEDLIRRAEIIFGKNSPQARQARAMVERMKVRGHDARTDGQAPRHAATPEQAQHERPPGQASGG